MNMSVPKNAHQKLSNDKRNILTRQDCIINLEEIYIPLRCSFYDIGVERSGMVGALAEIAALTLCVVSIWCPGSPFDITPNTTQLIHDGECLVDPC